MNAPRRYSVTYLVVIGCYLTTGVCGATKLAAADTTPSAAPQPKVVDVADAAAIEAAMPHDVTVAGTVSEIKGNENAATINFKGTENSRFYAVVLKRNRDAVEKGFGEGLKSLVDKNVQITGKIVEYRQTPEIVVSAPSQIVVLDPSKSSAAGAPVSPAHAAVIDVADKAAVLAAMPQEATVSGTISELKSSNDVVGINFKGAEKSQFNAVVLRRNKEAVEKVFGEGLKTLDGKRVRLVGTIVEYHDKPQIVISRPEQITVLEK